MSALITRYGSGLLRFAVLAAVPALLLLGVAIACGLLRTAALVLFAALLVLRGLMRGLERVGTAVPGPRLRIGGVA